MFFYKKLLGGGNSSNDTLLGKEEFDVEYSDDGTYKLASINIDEGRNRASKSRNNITWKAIHITLSLLNILVLATLIFQTNRPNHGPNLIASPAREAVSYKKQLFHDSLTAPNPYRGPPSPAIDAAWHDLVAWSNIRVSASQLRAINRTSVQLSDGSGDYMAQLNVHHQLHCLKSLRQALYPEYYPDNGRHKNDHIDHCLDNLRMAVMCNADISLQTFDWVDNSPRPLANFMVEHECVDFDALDAWAEDHSFELFDGVTLVHPFLGPSFPLDEEGKLIIEGGDSVLGNVITPPIPE